MQRPAQLFLAEGSNYYLAWKDGADISWIMAGTDFNPSQVSTTTTGDPSPPTVATISRDLTACATFYPVQTPVPVWDVSTHVGQHFPRIRRGEIFGGHLERQIQLSVTACGLDSAMTSGAVAAKLLFDEFEDVCEVIEPDAAQFGMYGHRLRHLLITACTEVESAWRSILVANSNTVPHILNTNHYVQLADPMRLRQYGVRFLRASTGIVRTPFAGWSATNPTGSLPWYAAYQATKHAREAALDQAQLGHALDALAAVYVMLAAQFGYYDVRERLRASHLFDVDASAGFTPNERYIPSPFDDGPWHEIKLFP